MTIYFEAELRKIPEPPPPLLCTQKTSGRDYFIPDIVPIGLSFENSNSIYIKQARDDCSSPCFFVTTS